MQNLFIIDAAGYAYRSYFAIRNMTNGKGDSTNSLYGFARSVLKILKDFKPEHCVAVFDGKNNSRARTAIYPEYKANRQSMPPDLLHQIQWAKDFCRLIGISMLDPEGVEADDTIGTIATYAAKKGIDVYICSTDKDLCQLVSDRISLVDTYKENLIIKEPEVKAKFGVPPSLIVDYLSLIGDASDNIPGVPGIGPKSAADLLNTMGSLDNLLANADQLKGKKKDLITEHKELALISRKLASLDLTVEFPEDDHFFVIKPTLLEELKAFYHTMQFHTLTKELLNQEAPIREELPSSPHTIIDDIESLKALIIELAKKESLGIKVEASHTNPMLAELIGIAIGSGSEMTWYIPLNGNLGKEVVLAELSPLFASSTIGFYGHNIKFDAHVLKNHGLAIKKIDFDTLLASYILNSHSRRHTLEELALELGIAKKETPSLGKGKAQITLKEVPVETLGAFSCDTVALIIKLKELFSQQITERGFSKLYYELELPLLGVLFDMEEKGIYLDINKVSELKEYLSSELAVLSSEIYALAGEEFNLNSPLQLSKILFEKLNIPAPKGASTGAEVLDELKWTYPIAGKIQEYRILEKLRSTYVETLPLQVNPKTNRIHCTFNQSVAATGRLSCQDPNLQNIPVRTETGLRIREAFKPEKENYSYIAADYSQIELRLLAHLSEDPILLSAFEKGEDIHQHTASVVFHVPLEEVTKEMRSRAKAVNFGIIYGQGAYGLSQVIKVSQKEAAQFIAHYFEQYPKVKLFLESCKDSARITGKTVTITGRERLVPEILSKNIQIRNAAERLAVNTPFQGSAADLIKLAMLNITEELKNSNLHGYMILQVHDELIFEVPDDEVPFFKNLIKNKMETVIDLKVPLIVDVEVGKNWKEC